MNAELFDRVRSRRVRYEPRDGDVLAINVKNSCYAFHIKVITAYIRSTSLFVDGATLIYIYVPHVEGGFVMHNKSSFYGLAALHFDGLLPCEFEFVGSEPVFGWERNLDFGFSRIGEAVEISEYERELYSKDHDIVQTPYKLFAVPFFDADNNQLEHVPYLKMNGEGYATVGGVLYTAAEWLRKHNII